MSSSRPRIKCIHCESFEPEDDFIWNKKIGGLVCADCHEKLNKMDQEKMLRQFKKEKHSQGKA